MTKKRRPLNLAEAARRYADAVCERMASPDTPITEFKLELTMAYMAGALRVVDAKPKEPVP